MTAEPQTFLWWIQTLVSYWKTILPGCLDAARSEMRHAGPRRTYSRRRYCVAFLCVRMLQVSIALVGSIASLPSLMC